MPTVMNAFLIRPPRELYTTRPPLNTYSFNSPTHACLTGLRLSSSSASFASSKILQLLPFHRTTHYQTASSIHTPPIHNPNDRPINLRLFLLLSIIRLVQDITERTAPDADSYLPGLPCSWMSPTRRVLNSLICAGWEIVVSAHKFAGWIGYSRGPRDEVVWYAWEFGCHVWWI